VNRSDFLKYSALLTFLPFMSDLKSLEHVTQSFISTPKMPVLFLGHGNPMYAIEENIFTQGFKEISIKIPQPSAIVCISAHWLTNGTYVTAMQQPKTIHDFGGFPKALFEVQYTAKGSPELAAETKDLITSTEIGLDHEWGLDHGTWSVLKHLYPLADVPVIQLSIDYGKPASYHFELARQLQSLRNKGVLIVGSGNMVHNLGRVDFPRMNELNYGYDWAKEASQIFNQLILDRNDKGLINYLQLGEAVKLAVPTPDHFYPLIYAAALRDKSDEVKLFNDTMVAGSLSMTSVLYA
jgi:4,5-DOPA dioxygenase extradiol